MIGRLGRSVVASWWLWLYSILLCVAGPWRIWPAEDEATYFPPLLFWWTETLQEVVNNTHNSIVFCFVGGGGVTTVETDWKQNSCHYSATSRYFGSCMMQLLFRICWVTRYSDCFWTRFKDIKKIQKNAFLLWHRYTICKFSFLFLSSSSKTTNNS